MGIRVTRPARMQYSHPSLAEAERFLTDLLLARQHVRFW